MSVTDIAVAQKACVLIGIEPITSFDDQTTEGKVLNIIYEDIVEAELVDYPWRFATQEQQINRLATAPESTWEAAYQIPPTYLWIQTVKVNSTPIRYDRFGDNIYCDAGENDTVILQGIVRVDESLWPPYFRLGIIYRLASSLASGVREDAALANAMANIAETWIRKARSNASQEQTTRVVNSFRFVNRRMG